MFIDSGVRRGGAVSLVVRLLRLDAGVHLSPRRLF